MEMENTVYTFAGVNCRLKVVNKENGEEIFFDNLGEVNLFLSQTVSYLRLFCWVDWIVECSVCELAVFILLFLFLSLTIKFR